MTEELKELKKFNVIESVRAEQFIALAPFILNRTEIDLKTKYSYKGDHVIYNRKETRRIAKAYEKDWSSYKLYHAKKLKGCIKLLENLNVNEVGEHGLLTQSIFDHLDTIIN